jgi:uncharacterized protein YerC
MALTQARPLSLQQRAELEGYLRQRNLPESMAQRMQIVIMLGDQATYREIGKALGTTAPTIRLWKKRYLMWRA